MSRSFRALVLVISASIGCDLLPMRVPAGRCLSNSDCGGGLICDLNRDRCVCPSCLDASATDAGADDSSSPDGSGDGVTTPDCPCDDASADHRGDRAECVSSADCHDPSKPLCGPGGTCLGCGAAGAPGCSAVDPAHPACGALGACVECATSSQCTTDATKPLCDTTGTCVSCGAAGAPTCASVDPVHPLCGPTGACVECTASSQCIHDRNTALCGASGTCVSCTALGAPTCASVDPAHPTCGAAGACLECALSSQCIHDPTKPLCGGAGTCVSCGATGAPSCATIDPAHPACGPTGACVECTTSSQCLSPLKPFCAPSTNTCGPCSSDSQCTGRGPGVCVASDGHCAADMETIYVAAPGGTCDPAPAGSATHPFCTLHDGVAAATASRNLLVVRGAVNSLGAVANGPALSIIGQQGAAVAPGTLPGLRVSGATVALRAITISSGFDFGLIAELGATIRLDGVTFDGNHKGGLRATASGFDVVNSIFVGNGGTIDEVGRFIGGAYLGAAPSPLPRRFDFNTVVQNKDRGVTCENPTQSLTADLFSANVAADASNCIVVSSKTSADGDPMLSSSYRLTGPSACRNAVTQAPAGAPDHDIDGTSRPQEGQYDCGASEFKP